MATRSVPRVARLRGWLALVLLGGCGCVSPRPEPPLPPPVPVAVWSYLDLARSETAQLEFFAFAERFRIRTLYLGAAGLLPGAAQPLADFLRAAQARGIAVALVIGRARWTEPAGQPEALDQVRAIRDFARALRASGQAAPVALQLDVEPYVLPGWNRGWARLAQSYLDLLEAVRSELAGELPLQVDLPVWWDRRDLRRQGVTRPLSQWAMAQADQTVLMDYRNRTEAILAGAADGLRVAARLQRQVVLGLAVHCDREPDNAQTSFCRKGHRALIQAMVEADRSLDGQAAFGGFAVFTYEDWRGLRP